ncbi:MAG: hypothetical protein JJE46_01725, partial [Acidimicrobiia bacterium]|nr:hypothetical protein [Acidimicrobiia bacterium]
MMIDLITVWVVGVLAAIPVVIWFANDIGKINGPSWYWAGHRREPWQWSVLLGWLAGGWLAMVVVLVWSKSAVRRDLQHDAHDGNQRRRRTDRRREAIPDDHR